MKLLKREPAQRANSDPPVATPRGRPQSVYHPLWHRLCSYGMWKQAKTPLSPRAVRHLRRPCAAVSDRRRSGDDDATSSRYDESRGAHRGPLRAIPCHSAATCHPCSAPTGGLLLRRRLHAGASQRLACTRPASVKRPRRRDCSHRSFSTTVHTAARCGRRPTNLSRPLRWIRRAR